MSQGYKRNIDEKSNCVYTARATLPVDPKLGLKYLPLYY
jgi:hypothetical protein